MNVSAPFIRRPVGTSLLTIALALAGLVAFNLLAVAPLPDVEFPTINVSASLPGASPETMASAVAMPLERRFGRIAGVTEMTSTSYMGSTSITLQFDLDRDIDAAGRDVQAAINAARGQLPAGLPSNPTYRKSNPADAPIMILALTSATMDVGRVYDVASSVLQQKVAQIEGVGRVRVSGSALPAVRVQLNPTALDRYGIGLDRVRAVLAEANVNRPKGAVSGPERSWQIRTSDQIFRPEEYASLVVAEKDGAVVRLADLGHVVESVEDVRNAGFSNRERAVLLIVYRQSGANIMETAERVRSLMPELEASIPPSIRLVLANDRTTTIAASIHDVELTLLASVVLVILVVFAFLRDPRATIVPSVVVPLSLVGTFGGMYLLGYTLDNLSLMALTISTGFVVDDAIVVLENVARWREQGLSAREAAFRGSQQIGFTVLSISVALVAAFLPILLMGGIVGRLFREFAVTMALAIGVSLVISLTTTPMMCAMLLREHRGGGGRIGRGFERAFDAVFRAYRSTLGWALARPRTVLAVAAATLALNVWLFVVVPKGFFPDQDTGRLMGMVQGEQDVSFEHLQGKLSEFLDLVVADPAVENAIAFTGGGGGRTPNTGRIFVALKPLDERGASASEVIARLRPRLSRVVGASLFLQSVQDIRVGGRMGNAAYQFTLEGDDLRELESWSAKMLEELRKLPQLADVNSDQQDGGLEAALQIDRDAASRLGVSTAAIDDTLYSAFGQRQVSTLYTTLNQYHVILEVEPRFAQDPAALRHVWVRSATSGALVPLAAVTRWAPRSSSLAVNHQGQFPAVTISFNLAPGFALGDAVDAIQAVERGMGLPATIQASFRGTAEAFRDSVANQPLLIAAAIVTVYIVLGILYESLLHPVTILSTLPSAGVGAILALLLCGAELTVIALIGIILLVGIVMKNAILMIDFALEAERQEGKSPAEAIHEACLLRFRPILMTTLAALLGALPLALGTGTGSELRRPLGIAIVGGLVLSQLLTLYTTPVVYLSLERLRLALVRLLGRRAAPVPAIRGRGLAAGGGALGR